MSSGWWNLISVKEKLGDKGKQAPPQNMPDLGPLAPLTLLNALGGLRFSRALSRLSLFLYGFYKTGK